MADYLDPIGIGPRWRDGFDAAGLDKADFELWSLAVSAINGCGKCMDAHEIELRKHGLTPQEIQTAVRAASIVHALAAVLDGEQAGAATQSQAA